MTSNPAQFQVLTRRIEAAIQNIGLDMNGLCVLTEAASGPYIATPVLAAVAGAKYVKACTRDSSWGSADDVVRMTKELADYFGVADRIDVCTGSPVEIAHGADVVTNLGFVRPISRALVRQLPANSAIALMWEPWEFRAEDIDLAACREYGIPVVATNEHSPKLETFKAVGMLALKLLLECQCEVSGLEVIVVGSNPFGQACSNVLTAVGASVTLLDPNSDWPNNAAVPVFNRADAVVLAEHRYRGELFGSSTVQLVKSISERGIPFVHICGTVDANYLSVAGVKKHPSRSVPNGFMTVTTAYLGIKPVVDLHAAGLHVASIVSRERKNGASFGVAISKAVASGYGLDLFASDTITK